MVYRLNNKDIYILQNLYSPTISEYEKGELVRYFESHGKKIGVIIEGTIYMCCENDDFDRTILKVFKIGDIISKNMLLPAECGVSYFMAKQKSRAAFFDKSNLLSYMVQQFEENNKSSEFSEELIHIFILQQKSIKSKLMSYFKYESKKQNSRSIKVPMPFSDLAEYLGIDRAALMRGLSQLKKDKLIDYNRHDVKILGEL
ncbi:MAG: Crp/Fnr family transcriptional regulator [Oscillospiraceae bacterium]